MQISSAVAGAGAFSVDLTGLKAANTGEYWNATAWSAATYAALASEVDPRGLSISFDISETIDGPSASGLMALGATAELAHRQVPADASMTGTIFPGGGLGPVSGIPDKVRAAASAGITRVFIPMGQGISVDLGTREEVDVVALGRTVGVEVIETRSMQDAYKQLIGDPAGAVGQDVAPMDPDLLAFLNTQTTLVRSRLEKVRIAPAPTPGTNAERRQVVAAVAYGRSSSQAALAASNSVAAFVDATMASRPKASR